MKKVIQGSLSFLTGFVCSVILFSCGVETVVVYQEGGMRAPDSGMPHILKADALKTDMFKADTLKTDSVMPADASPAPHYTVLVPAQRYLLSSTENASKPTWVDLGTDSIMSYLKGSDGDQWCDGTNYLIYEIALPSSGLYYLYFTGRYGTAADGVLGTEGLNDSFYVSTDFNTKPNTTINGYDGDFKNASGENFLNKTSGMYKTIKKYQVLNAGTYRFMVGAREDGMILDSFTFSTDSGLK